MKSEKDEQAEKALIEGKEKLEIIVKSMWELAQNPISRWIMRVSVMGTLSRISAVPTDDEGNFLKGEPLEEK